MHKLYHLSVAAALCFTACNNAEKKEETSIAATETKQVMSPSSKLSDANTQKLVSLVNTYYELKDAMVATNAAKADEAAQKLQTVAADAVGAIKTDSVNFASFQPYFDTVINSSKQLAAVKDATCEVKRIHFEKVSDAMYNIVKRADVRNAGIYREYCPMAFNDKGAYWLSNDPEIKNPYFGKKMLECGEIADSLK